MNMCVCVCVCAVVWVSMWRPLSDVGFIIYTVVVVVLEFSGCL